MGFGDLNTAAGQSSLNKYLEDRSYIDGHTPTQADTVVFAALGHFSTGSYVHLNRWYKHIESYGNDAAKFPGQKKNVSAYGPGVTSASATTTGQKAKGNIDKSTKTKNNQSSAGEKPAAEAGAGDTHAEIEALKRSTNVDGTPKTEAQIKKDLKKLEKLEKFLAKQAKLEAAKAQKDGKSKTDEVTALFS